MHSRVVHRGGRLFRFAVDLFIQLLKQVTGRRVVRYACNNADTAAWAAFTAAFPDNIGEDFVRRFCEYGIQSWFNSGVDRDYSRAIRFSWVFGKSAIERWRMNDAGTNDFIVRSCLKRTYKINTVRRSGGLSEAVGSLRAVEEGFRRDFHNTRRGLAWCVANTTLYDHKSPLCVTCIHKAVCKATLAQEYPKLYIKRGYVKG